jgi:DNA-binding response OmpR family regulator
MHQDKEISLTPIEFQLLEKLIENNGRIIKRESLLGHMWDDYGNFVENNTLTVTVSRLKAKLGKDVATGRSYIETIYGIGYRWMGGEDH